MYNVPAQPKINIYNIDNFMGVDFSSSILDVNERRSPNSYNMINRNGFNEKRYGWKTVATCSDRINGIYTLGSKNIVHTGNKLYEFNLSTGVLGTLLRSDMGDRRSTGIVYESKLWILDGSKYKVYDGTSCVDVSTIATIPNTIINRNPDGTGGTTLDDVNLIQPKQTVGFLGLANVKTYNLNNTSLNATTVTARKLNAQGEWVDLVENTDFTVNRTTGVVTFNTAPRSKSCNRQR